MSEALLLRRRAMMATHKLSSAYEELEYIEGTGTQYINTGYVLTPDSEIIATTRRTSATAQGYNGSDWGSAAAPRGVTAGIYWSWGSASDKNNPAYNPDIPFGTLTVRVNINGLYSLLGNKVVDFGTLTWSYGSNPTYLMARNNNGTADRLCKVRFYYWAAYENGTKMIELIPAKRISDSAIGMYDTVSGNFLTNAGTGDFLAGTFN